MTLVRKTLVSDENDQAGSIATDGLGFIAPTTASTTPTNWAQLTQPTWCPRIPRAVLTWGVFSRHPHPGHACGCEWDDTWRMVWASSTEPGAVSVTAMRHPAADVTAAGIPNPDTGVPATWAA